MIRQPDSFPLSPLRQQSRIDCRRPCLPHAASLQPAVPLLPRAVPLLPPAVPTAACQSPPDAPWPPTSSSPSREVAMVRHWILPAGFIIPIAVALHASPLFAQVVDT